MNKNIPKPVVLIILDGWGHTDNTVYNAIHAAQKPTWDRLWQNYPHRLISASGIDIGLPPAQMGNSEVGHMTLGAGRTVDQEFTRINRALKDGSFYRNETLSSALTTAAAKGKALHLLGLLSPGGVHSHENHILALIELAAQHGIKKLYLHAFTDGRDTPPMSALESIHKAQFKMKQVGIGCFASIIGRHYAMDRNRHWERTSRAYELITNGQADYYSNDPFIAVDIAYKREETDEFISPTAITADGKAPVTVADGDVIIFANYRADRARQLARAFTKTDFKAFARSRMPQLDAFISLTSYKAGYEFPVAFPPVSLSNVFGEYISQRGLKQLRIAETEKYAHVTFFFNGGEERAFDGEDRILVPSPHVETYDQQAEMSAHLITERMIEAIKRNHYDAVICNFANADMVGHTGNFNATITAVQTIDECLKRIVACLKKVGGELIITADHGNAEQMRSYTTEKIKSHRHTAHTSNPVPFIYVGRAAECVPADGVLSDIAPTLLKLMGLPQPDEMTGQSLIRFLA